MRGGVYSCLTKDEPTPLQMSVPTAVLFVVVTREPASTGTRLSGDDLLLILLSFVLGLMSKNENI